MTTRRDFLRGSAAAIAAVAAAPMALADGLPIGIESITLEPPKLVAFMTGCDEHWSAVFAETKEEAARLFADQYCYFWCNEEADAHCGKDDCYECDAREAVEARRHQPFDQYEKIDHVPMRAWFAAGFAVPCVRCEDLHPGYDHDWYPDRADMAEVEGQMLCVECQPIERAMIAAFGPRIS